MKKTLAAGLAIATIAASFTMTPASAQRGVAAGVAAGLIGGAIVGGAIASSRAPVYVEGPPPPGGCYWRHQRYWDGYGWTVRPVRVCY